MENKKSLKQFDKMTKTPVRKLINTLAVPTIISMMITIIYNLADTYFVSKISVASSGATGIIFSLMGIIQAFSFMFGHGSGSCASRKLGAKDTDTASKYSSTGFFLGLIFGILMMVFGLIFLTPLVTAMGSTATILPYAKTYGMYILIAAPAMSTSFVMNNVLRFEGKASLAMIGLTTGAVLNIALDPLLIFVFDLGIAGAGIATAVSQYIGMVILLSMYLRGKTQCKIKIRYAVFKPQFVWEIVSTGLPSLARQGLNSVATMIMNIQATPFGDECIAAMSISAKCMMFIFSVCLGIGQGFQPVCGFNYGAKLCERVRTAIKYTWKMCTIVTALLSAIVFALAPIIVAAFRSDAQVVEIGTAALRFMCVAMLFSPTVMMGNMTFQSIGRTGPAFFLACSQNGLFFIPLVLILPNFIGVTGIEVAQPAGYVISAGIAVPYLLKFLKELKTKATD
ncbi:MAG: MATE family efflux transporter [Ruminococcaceae bacterium]|nr:MATE family efflux transporter [Oscillospiraceae bacterium]